MLLRLKLTIFILDHVQDESKEYRSIDTVVSTEDAIRYPQELLNSLNPAGFPRHNLQLKFGVPISLRNLNSPKLFNGTRVQVKVMQNNVSRLLFYRISSRRNCPHPRIPMIPTNFPFVKRLPIPNKNFVCYYN